MGAAGEFQEHPVAADRQEFLFVRAGGAEFGALPDHFRDLPALFPVDPDGGAAADDAGDAALQRAGEGGEFCVPDGALFLVGMPDVGRQEKAFIFVENEGAHGCLDPAAAFLGLEIVVVRVAFRPDHMGLLPFGPDGFEGERHVHWDASEYDGHRETSCFEILYLLV